ARAAEAGHVRHEQAEAGAGHRVCVALVEAAAQAEPRHEQHGRAASLLAPADASAATLCFAGLQAHVLARKSSTTRLNSAGRSHITLCAASSITTKRAPGMASAMRRPCS